MQKTPMRQQHRLSVFLMFVVVMSYPLVVQAMPESFVVEHAVRVGKYDKRAYNTLKGYCMAPSTGQTAASIATRHQWF